jgi:hypothetical protein
MAVITMQAAFVTNKYHLAKTLIQRIRGKNELPVKLDHGKTLAHILAETARPCSAEELIAEVSGQLYTFSGHIADDCSIFIYFYCGIVHIVRKNYNTVTYR